MVGVVDLLQQLDSKWEDQVEHVDADEAPCRSRNTHDEGYAGGAHGEVAVVDSDDDDLMTASEVVARNCIDGCDCDRESAENAMGAVADSIHDAAAADLDTVHNFGDDKKICQLDNPLNISIKISA